MYDEVNMQDSDEVDGHVDNIGPDDPLEEFSDNYNQGGQDRQQMTQDDPKNVRLPMDTWGALHLESYDSDDIFASAKATAANAYDVDNINEHDAEQTNDQDDDENNNVYVFVFFGWLHYSTKIERPNKRHCRRNPKSSTRRIRFGVN